MNDAAPAKSKPFKGSGVRESYEWNGYGNTNLDQVSKKFFNTGQARIHIKTLSEYTFIADEVIYRHQSFKYVSTTESNLPWPHNFSAFLV